LKDAENVYLIAFLCSFVASSDEIVKLFPQWIQLDAHGQVVEIDSTRSQRMTDQLMALTELTSDYALYGLM